MQIEAQGSHQSFYPHTGRWKPLHWCLCGGLGTFGSLSLSCSRSWSRSCSCRLGLGLSLGLGLWPAEPETLGNAGTSTFPELGVSDVSKSIELAAATLWDLGLDLLGLDKGLDSLGTCTHGLGVVGLHLLQALLVVLLGKAHVPQELGVYLEGKKKADTVKCNTWAPSHLLWPSPQLYPGDCWAPAKAYWGGRQSNLNAEIYTPHKSPEEKHVLQPQKPTLHPNAPHTPHFPGYMPRAQ